VTRQLVALAGIAALVTVSSACTPASACPRTVDEARQIVWDDEIVVGGGYVIRFVPAAIGPDRGYDINVTRPVSERARMDTFYLRTPIEIPGIEAGMPVLLIGARTDRNTVVVQGPECPALTPTTEEDVTRRAGD
jgi:hypothetical protein